jgi:L-fucose isomerase
MEQTTLGWPHAFAKFACSAEEFLASYGSNHIHAVYGEWVDELRMVADLLGIETQLYGDDVRETTARSSSGYNTPQHTAYKE